MTKTVETNPVPVLSDDEVAEIAAMFPHTEYQPTLSPDEVDPCEFCKGTIDDHKANCVVPHVHALCQTVRVLRTSFDISEAARSHDNDCYRELLRTKEAENTALREQLAQVTQERKRLQKSLDDWASGTLTDRELIGKVQQITNWQSPEGRIEISGGTGPVAKEQP